MTTRILLTATLCLAIGAAMVGAQDAPPKPKDRFDRQLRVGTVNLADLFDESKCESCKTIGVQLKAVQAKLQEGVLELQKKAEDLLTAIKVISDPTSDLYFKKVGEYESVKSELESKGKLGNAQLKLRLAQFQLKYYNTTVKDAIQAVAAALKLDMVLRLEEPASPEDSAEGVMRRMGQRVVLFSNTELDITKEVLEKLNKK